ncbi:TetR/AcrR family transcriptional regulator [Sorangium sp. So ce448]|uniref:TetR/AcrR family transcriptional regulator n=1 Tax=Sorangium sp. So ce448 TaxID=3133314 RepID=UPI003F635D76
MAKGEDTRQAILAEALALASEVGLSGVTVGALAERVKMSKSGLFAHFSSKENLDVAILEEAKRRFVDVVVAPALREPRGEPRVRALIDRWFVWTEQDFMPGGCVFHAAAAELDDKPGPARDALVASQKDWLATLATAARIAVEEGHFRSDLDLGQFAFEAYAIASGSHALSRLMREKASERRARAAFERLVADARRSPRRSA